jgi:hypothetical protein
VKHQRPVAYAAEAFRRPLAAVSRVRNAWRAFRRSIRIRWVPLLLIGLPTVVALVLMYWPSRPLVTMHVLAKQIGFRIDAETPQQISEKIDVRSVVFRAFDQLTVPANSVRIANAALYDLRNDTYPDSALTPALGTTNLTIRPKPGKLARVAIESWTHEAGAMGLDRLHAASTTVTIARREKAYVSVQLRGGQQQISLRVSPDIRVVADDAMAAELPQLSAGSSVTLRVLADSVPSFVESKSSSALTIGFELMTGVAEPWFSKNYRMSHVEFLEGDLMGEATSTIIGDGKISFDNYPDITPIPLGTGQFLLLDPTDTFNNDGIIPTDDGRGFSVTVRGAATRLSTGPKGSIADRRPSLFTVLSHSPVLTKLFTFVGLLVPTLEGIRRLVVGPSRKQPK